jgi:tRNA U34 5-carboxymethylaminomethyl modifying GTPase MnmE/TrmE
MNTFILFIFGMFEDHEDIEYFCVDVIGEMECIKSVRYVIENSQNIIVIFDSDSELQKLSKDMFDVLKNDSVRFYFIFDRSNLVSAHVPQQIKDFIYKPSNAMFMNLEYVKPESLQVFELDDLLEKIEKTGMDSLTSEEKKFLDDFEN